MGHVATIGTATATTAVSSLTVTLTAGAAAGHTVMGAVVWESSAGTIPTISAVTDSRGNTWTTTPDVSAGGSGNATVACAVLRARVTTALQSGDTVTITITGGTRNRWAAQIDDFDDAATSPLDKTAHNDNPGSATTLASGTTAATTQPAELLYAVYGFALPSARTVTIPSDWSGGAQVATAAGSSNRALQAVWRYTTQTGAKSGTISLDTASTYCAAIGTYKTTAGPSAHIAQAKLSIPNPGDAKLARIAQVRFAVPRPATGTARIAQVTMTAPTAPGQRPPSGIKTLDGGALHEAGLSVAAGGEL